MSTTTQQTVLNVVSPVSSNSIIWTLVRNAKFQASSHAHEWETDGSYEEGVKWKWREGISEGNKVAISVLTNPSSDSDIL